MTALQPLKETLLPVHTEHAKQQSKIDQYTDKNLLFGAFSVHICVTIARVLSTGLKASCVVLGTKTCVPKAERSLAVAGPRICNKMQHMKCKT